MGLGIEVTPLTSTIGARVTGVDVAAGLDGETAAIVGRALFEHLVLVLPGQRLTGEQRQAFAALFGAPQPYPVGALFGDQTTIVTIDNELIAPADDADLSDTGFGSQHGAWHSDYTFNEFIPSVATLRAELVPPVGGDTVWASMHAAFDALSVTMQDILLGLRAVHWSGPLFPRNFGLSRFGPDALSRFEEAFPPRAHPMVVTHPETGRRALFVNPSYTVRVEGMTAAESRALLDFLFRHLQDPAFLYRHHWDPDDLVIWDERATVHLAPTDFHPHRRRLVRVAAGATVPALLPAAVHA